MNLRICLEKTCVQNGLENIQVFMSKRKWQGIEIFDQI